MLNKLILNNRTFSRGKFVSRWKTNNNEILIIDEKSDYRQRYKYEITDGNLLLCNQLYYRTFEEALEAA